LGAKGLALDAMLGTRRFSTVRDIGAGSGMFARPLLRRGVGSAVYVDPAYREEYDASIAGRPITFTRQIRGRKADLVLLMDVLEHVDDDVGLVRHAPEGAAEWAHVLITVPAFQILYSADDGIP
jgi:2-polyprenyl-3-methyl-5-hydroxy-6-metoxy-1,4-benzoquinol methylase